MTNRRQYLCPDGSEPCGRYGFCGYCPHDKKAKNRPSSANATEADVLMDDLAESLQKLMILTDGGGTWTLEDQDRAQAALKNYQEYVK